MKKTRMMTGMVLTAGLGLTGVVAASSSGAATPSATSAHTAQAAPAQPVFVTTAGKGGGKGPVCVVVKVGPGVPGKSVPGKPLPAKPGTPGTLALPAVPGATLPAKPSETVKVVGGKVYVNGKLVKGANVDTRCPLPPLPPLPGKGKGVVCVIDIRPGKGHPKPGAKDRTTVKVVNGKMYVNGKLVPGAKPGKPGKDCALPPFPGKGGGVVVKPGKGGAGSVTFPAPGGGSLTWSQGGTTKGGSTDSTNEAGPTTSNVRG